MHELLAVCLFTVDRDSLERVESKKDVSTQAMGATLDRHYVEHDAFDLFMAIMKPAKAFYEWRQEEGPVSAGLLEASFSANGQKRAQSGQAPIIIRSNNLHSSLIRRIDPQMWERLENEGIEAQLWAMWVYCCGLRINAYSRRWYKLIFTRELPFSLALRLWDGIFAEDPGLGLLDFICVAMLLLIRNECRLRADILGADGQCWIRITRVYSPTSCGTLRHRRFTPSPPSSSYPRRFSYAIASRRPQASRSSYRTTISLG